MVAAGWRFAAAAAALAAYAVLSFWLMVNAAREPWTVAVIFGPLVLAMAATGWRRRQPLVLCACVAGVVLLAWVVARGGVHDVNRMYVLQHVGIHLALAWGFGMTLRTGSTALITTMAQTLHERFPAELRAYTRWLTGLWTGYFLAVVVLSLALYAFAPWSWWSLFANVLTPVSALLLAVTEHVQRYRRHPEFERVGLRAMLSAYRRASIHRAGAPQ